MPAQALTVGNAGEPQAAKPVEEKVDGTWLQHDVQAGETLYSIFRKFELPGPSSAGSSPSKGRTGR